MKQTAPLTEVYAMPKAKWNLNTIYISERLQESLRPISRCALTTVVVLGECDLIMSFLCYNDISAMSRLHRSASSRMSRPAISIQSGGGWTFGSPSAGSTARSSALSLSCACCWSIWHSLRPALAYNHFMQINRPVKRTMK